jgi:hypothetical protein
MIQPGSVAALPKPPKGPPMKPTLFRFWVVDQPAMATVVGRKWLAHALRAFRKAPGRYLLRRSRAGLHRYTVVHDTFVICIEPA